MNDTTEFVSHMREIQHKVVDEAALGLSSNEKFGQVINVLEEQLGPLEEA